LLPLLLGAAHGGHAENSIQSLLSANLYFSPKVTAIAKIKQRFFDPNAVFPLRNYYTEQMFFL